MIGLTPYPLSNALCGVLGLEKTGINAAYLNQIEREPTISTIRAQVSSGALIEQLPGFYAIEDMHIKAMRAMAGITYSY